MILTDNVCCAKLLVVDCGDTDEHRHFVCEYPKAILKNETIIKVCILKPSSCVLRSDNEGERLM